MAEAMMKKVQQEAMVVLDKLDAQADALRLPVFETIRKKTGLRPSVVILGAGFGLVLLMLVLFGHRSCTMLVGFVYPVYGSYLAIKSPQADDDTQWLTYWVFFGFFAVGESFGDALFGYIPLYPLVKLGLLVWAFLPQTKGAQLIFKTLIEPFLSKHEKTVDDRLRKSVEVAKDLADKVIKPSISDATSAAAEKLLSSGGTRVNPPVEGSPN